jgi:hypothetical protein
MNNNNNKKDYRFDHRTKEEFAADIAKFTAIEKELMIDYVNWLNSKLKDKTQKYIYYDNGIDNSGKYLESDEVDSRPDFILLTPSGKSRLIEIKFSRNEHDKFHIKLTHVKRCIAEDICLVMWMATETPNKRFCILTPEKLRTLAQDLDRIVKFKPWGYKECLRITDKDVDWNK